MINKRKRTHADDKSIGRVYYMEMCLSRLGIGKGYETVYPRFIDAVIRLIEIRDKEMETKRDK